MPKIAATPSNNARSENERNRNKKVQDAIQRIAVHLGMGKSCKQDILDAALVNLVEKDRIIQLQQFQMRILENDRLQLQLKLKQVEEELEGFRNGLSLASQQCQQMTLEQVTPPSFPQENGGWPTVSTTHEVPLPTLQLHQDEAIGKKNDVHTVPPELSLPSRDRVPTVPESSDDRQVAESLVPSTEALEDCLTEVEGKMFLQFKETDFISSANELLLFMDTSFSSLDDVPPPAPEPHFRRSPAGSSVFLNRY